MTIQKDGAYKYRSGSFFPETKRRSPCIYIVSLYHANHSHRALVRFNCMPRMIRKATERRFSRGHSQGKMSGCILLVCGMYTPTPQMDLDLILNPFPRDTVSSVGFLRPKKMLPRVVGCCDHICVFRHALALDERRVKFLPEFIHEGASHTDDENIKFPGKNHPKCTADIKEGWFAGSHSDV